MNWISLLGLDAYKDRLTACMAEGGQAARDRLQLAALELVQEKKTPANTGGVGCCCFGSGYHRDAFIVVGSVGVLLGHATACGSGLGDCWCVALCLGVGGVCLAGCPASEAANFCADTG